MILKKLIVYALIGLVASALAYYFIDRSAGKFINMIFVDLCHVPSNTKLVMYGVPFALFAIIYAVLISVYLAIRIIKKDGEQTLYDIVRMFQK